MPHQLQAKLLRVLEDKVVTPVGGNHERVVDVRFLSATNTDLQRKVADGRFREDLFFRLAGFTVTIPPLRERPDDVPLLAAHFLNTFATDMRIEKPAFSGEALEALTAHPFPGNVRELRNLIERALLESDGGTIQPQHIHFIDLQPSSEQPTSRLILSRQERGKNQGANLSGQTDEEKILAYIRQHGNINNTECRDLLAADLRRASYLLIKMHESGVLVREGERRWSRYRLP